MVTTRQQQKDKEDEDLAAAEQSGDSGSSGSSGSDGNDDVGTVDLNTFIEAGAAIMSRAPPNLLPSKAATSTESFEERWTSHFNAEVEVCLDLWNRLEYESFDGLKDFDTTEPRHLLWALLFLEVYAVDNVLAGMCECDEETFRKYVFMFIEKVSYYEHHVVSTDQLSDMNIFVVLSPLGPLLL